MPGNDDHITKVFVAHPPAQTDRYIEVMITETKGVDFKVLSCDGVDRPVPPSGGVRRSPHNCSTKGRNNMSTERDYTDRADRGGLPIIPGTQRRGSAAAEDRRMLIAATGGRDLDEAVHLALGRPTLAEVNRGPSPTWRLRTTKELDDTVRRVALERGMTVSSFIREAVVAHIHPNH